MPSTHVLSALEVATLAEALGSGLHDVTITRHGIAVCCACGRTWNREAYAADTTRCPGRPA